MTNELAHCACCGNQRSVPFLRGLRKCPRCTHVWADMELGEEELRRLYDRSYFEGSEYLDYAREASALKKNFGYRLRELRRNHSRGERLFEIGSAYGFFLEIARKHFRVAGCEISSHAADFAREKGLRVIVGDYRALPEPKTPYDIVCLWDTIEHLAAPAATLRKATSELRPGGTLAISTGDIGSLVARLRGEKWRLIHPPTHLHYFSEQSIRALLRQLGYRRIEVTRPPFWRSADAVAYRLLAWPEGNQATPLYNAARRIGALNFTFPLNTWDLMTVYATK